MYISKDTFIERIIALNINDLSLVELNKLAKFISTSVSYEEVPVIFL